VNGNVTALALVLDRDTPFVIVILRLETGLSFLKSASLMFRPHGAVAGSCMACTCMIICFTHEHGDASIVFIKLARTSPCCIKRFGLEEGGQVKSNGKYLYIKIEYSANRSYDVIERDKSFLNAVLS
jgi:hypothetical protein